MKKGIALAVGGIVIFSIFIAAVWLMSFAGDTTKTYLTFHGEIAMSAMNEAYLTRKNVDQGLYYIAQRAAYELGKEGAGVATWTKDNPQDDFIKLELIDKIDSMLPSGKVQGSYLERNIEWEENNLQIIENDQYFQISGKQDFILTDTRVNLELKSSVPFDQKVDSSYFRLIDVGRKVFEDDYQDIINSGGDVATELKNKFGNDPDHDELEFSISISGNDIIIKIIDKSCDFSNPYCLAPLKEDEIDLFIDNGVTFGYLTLEFKIAKLQPF